MSGFIDDITFENLIYGFTVRSMLAKARIKKIKFPSLPEGYVSVTAKDIPKVNLTSYGYNMLFIAGSVVRYIGEPIALLAGPNKNVLYDLSNQVKVEYGEEQPVFAPLTGEGIHYINYAKGNTEQALKDAYQIVEGEYRTAAHAHLYLEPQGAIACWDGKTLMLYSSTQDPFSVQRECAALLGLQLRKVRVVVPKISESYEGKLLPSLIIASHAALLSYKTKKPVKLIYDRQEDFLYTPKSHSAIVRHRTALNREGNITGMKVNILLDSGAYASSSSKILLESALAACGVYSCANIDVHAEQVLTNKAPASFFTGSGSSQVFFAAELHASRLEEMSQSDPCDWRVANLGKRTRDSSGAQPVLDTVARHSDFRRKYSAYTAVKKRRKSLLDSTNPLRGIGLSLCSQGTGYYYGTGGSIAPAVKVRFDTDKKLTIFTSIVEIGEIGVGFRKQIISLVSKILDLDPEKIRLEPVDTHNVPDTGPTTCSNAFIYAASLVEKCCYALQKKRLIRSLPIEVRKSLKSQKNPTRDSRAFIKSPYESYSWAGTVVELEIDPVTFQSNCLGIWMAVEAGCIRDEDAAESILKRRIVQAFGYTYAELKVNQGRIIQDELNYYSVPGVLDIPPIHVFLIEDNEPSNKGAAKAFDELPSYGIAPAYTAAISQATGLYFDRFPVTGEVIQACLENE